ncbi:MAG: prepilin-type N-terminal cleavage/methylation domain-containing protein [Thiomicrospira sp.]|uniref:prepilin-type N-terminal cleavage/methylation domain-containing protein n=1 Tax=Thiomicrospira sp. TaxID=935 RepID=UPI0019E4C4A6|nr:prepilin-type N-terminal cleavage/methylation domain-containing protein [Thiomicrospira sp.]MBE0494577.1 prepilin-type N-terminal cleavage/methylation domain-containing protein [Thiomicrospira sp.]
MFLNLSTQKGFSLLEMALALLLVGILIQSVTSMLVQNKQHQTYKQTEQELQNIKQVLLSYIQINQFLPCPDTNGNGLENRETDGQCSADQGSFPYLEFGGIGQKDEFGNPYFYATHTDTTNNDEIRNSCFSASLFANSGSFSLQLYERKDDKTRHCTLDQCQKSSEKDPDSKEYIMVECDTLDIISRTQAPYFNTLTQPLGTTTALNGALRVCGQDSTSCVYGTGLSKLSGNHLPLVVISFGQNGAQTWQDCNQASDREQENCDSDRYFQQQPIDQDFDDQLIWITMHEVKALLSQHINWHNE